MSLLDRLVRRRKAPSPPPHDHPRLRRRIAELQAQQDALRDDLMSRLNILEDGLEEQRRLNDRITELTDMVAELIAAAARIEDPAFADILNRYKASP